MLAGDDELDNSGIFFFDVLNLRNRMATHRAVIGWCLVFAIWSSFAFSSNMLALSLVSDIFNATKEFLEPIIAFITFNMVQELPFMAFDEFFQALTLFIIGLIATWPGIIWMFHRLRVKDVFVFYTAATRDRFESMGATKGKNIRLHSISPALHEYVELKVLQERNASKHDKIKRSLIERVLGAEIAKADTVLFFDEDATAHGDPVTTAWRERAEQLARKKRRVVKVIDASTNVQDVFSSVK